jgi:hypothetical protein
MKLTKPQRRILEDAVRDGKTIVGGRNIPAVNNLKDAGLITADWVNERGGQQWRWNITVRPTDAGREAVAQ